VLAPEQPTSDGAPTASGSRDAPGTTTFLAPPPEPELPRRIGRYRIIRELGKGGQGIVYLGRHRYLGVDAAVKVMTVPMDPERRRAFLREARRLVRLRGHPGIVELREFGLYRPASGPMPAPYLATDLVPGGGQRLTEYARDVRLDLAARLALFARVCDAVEHAHGLDVIHLDLKPGNILVVPGTVDRPACPKVIDFGVARAADPAHEKRRSSTGGTLRYMSPEQTTGSTLDPRSDVYSLGVVLYELLTGSMPYRLPSDTMGAMRAIREEPPDFGTGEARGLPGAVRAIIAKAMAKSPGDRYATAGEMGADVSAYVRGGVPPGLRRNLALRAVLSAGALCARRLWLVAALVVLASALLTLYVGVPLLYSWTGASNWFERTFAVPVATGDKLEDVVLVTATEETKRAWAAKTPDAFSYRAVYGDLMKRMATAPPRVVVFDHDMPDARPVDGQFVEGVQTLWGVACPVVLGTQSFDLEEGLPRVGVMSPMIAGAVTGWGDLGISGDAETPWSVALVYRWDDGEIDPALSLVATAMAARNPAAVPHLFPWYELKDANGPVVAHFGAKLRAAASLVQPRPDLDLTIRVSEVRSAAGKRPPERPDWTGDPPVAAYIEILLPSEELIERSTKTLEEVMASPEPCRGKIVLVFDKTNADDLKRHPGGLRRGAYGHATAIQSLVSQRLTRRPNRSGQLLIPLIGAAAGLVLPWPVVKRRSWWPRWAVAGSVAAWVGLTLIALAAGVAAAWWMDYLFNPLVLVFGMVTTAVLWLGVDRLRRVYPLLKEARG
jgi:hypothetical protein